MSFQIEKKNLILSERKGQINVKFPMISDNENKNQFSERKG
jgi:hypothetical protein